MRVLCTSTPMEGVVGPLLPIAHVSRARGHEVLLAVGPDVQRRVEAAGLEATVVGPPAMDTAHPDDVGSGRRGITGCGSDLRWGDVRRGVRPGSAPTTSSDCRRVWSRRSRASAGGGLSLIVAAERGAPSVTYGFGQLLDDAMVRAAGRPGSHRCGKPLACRRTRHAGIYRDRFLDPCPPSMRLGGAAPARVVQLIQPEIPEAGSDSLPAEIAALGDRPVLYVTLGTVPLFNQLATFEVLLDAVAGEDIDVVATIGSNNDPAALSTQRPNVRVHQWLPLRPLLERCDAVMCHGGSGTTLAALNAGLPLVIVPQGADQFENALACEQSGAARWCARARLRPRSSVTPSVR